MAKKDKLNAVVPTLANNTNNNNNEGHGPLVSSIGRIKKGNKSIFFLDQIVSISFLHFHLMSLSCLVSLPGPICLVG